MSQSGSQQDMYSREYGRSGAALSYRGSGKPDIYNRDYVRAKPSGKTAPDVAYQKASDMPAIQSTPSKTVVEKKEAPAHTEPQPSIFDKISQFLHGVIGSK